MGFRGGNHNLEDKGTKAGPQKQLCDMHLEEGTSFLESKVKCKARRGPSRVMRGRMLCEDTKSASIRGRGHMLYLVRRGACIHLVEHRTSMDLPRRV